MMSDPDAMADRIAYIDAIRGMHRRKRLAAFVGCLVGVIVLAYGRFRPEAPEWAVWAGLAIIVVSWLVFAYVIFARLAFVRAHPFDQGN